MGVAQIYGFGSTCMVAIPSFFRMYVGWSYVEIDKTNKLGIQAKVQFQDNGSGSIDYLATPF